MKKYFLSMSMVCISLVKQKWNLNSRFRESRCHRLKISLKHAAPVQNSEISAQVEDEGRVGSGVSGLQPI